MFIQRIVSTMMFAAMGTTMCMDDDSSVALLAKKAAIGTVAGACEVTANSPLIYFKNTLQQPGLSLSMNPKVWYRGYGMNVAAMGPTTAVQIGADAGLERLIPGTDVSSKIARAFTAGALSATVNGPVELVIIDQQKNHGNALSTCKKVFAAGGWSVLTRGWAATAFREGGFTTGYLVIFPLVEEAIKNAQGAVQDDIDNVLIKKIVSHSALAYGGAGAATGVVVALGTHPSDTVKTRLQADYQRAVFKSTKDAVRAVVAEKGLKGLFAGAAPRAVRAGLAIPLIGTLKKYFSGEEKAGK